MIDDDKWHHVGKVFTVLERHDRLNSTAVHLVLEDEDGVEYSLVVAKNQIVEV
jgi:hypothetical protein